MSEIPVYVRVRPLRDAEREDAWHLEDASLRCTSAGKDASTYHVNKVFPPNSTNASVFSGAAQEIVSHALQGYSGTVFAYGQTASGKTHTMMGGAGEPGLVQTALGYMYGEMARDTEADYIVRCLAMEVYNERLSCLKTDTELTIKEGRGAEPLVVGVRGGEGASSVVVSSAEEATSKLETAMSRRHVRKTKMNDQSSRSHTIFRLQIDRLPKGGAGRKASRSTNTSSILHLVDLAGAESMKKTGATGAAVREGSNINKSLSALVRVIHCLTGGKDGEYIPFRDSKLTRLLKTSLGGNTKTAIVCCVTPATGQYDQTASTLRFAQQASKVKNDPKKCVLSGEIPPALRRTLQAMAEAQTAEAREEHKRDVAQLMEQMEALRQEAQQKEETARLLESERAKRRAAESALREEQDRNRQTRSPTRGSDQQASVGPNTPRKRLSSGMLDGLPTSTQGKRVCFDAEFAAVQTAKEEKEAEVRRLQAKLQAASDSNAALQRELEAAAATPLRLAIDMHNREMATLLLDAGCDTEATTYLGFTSLHHAIDTQDIEMATLLLDAGCDKEVENDFGDTPLHHAVTTHSVEMVELLLDAGCNKEATTYLGFTPLHHAIAKQNVGLVELLLDAGCDKDAKCLGFTPLHHALDTQSRELVELLLDVV